MATNLFTTNDTISSAMEVWLYQYKKPAVKAATFTRLVASFDLMKRHPIALVRLADVQTDDIQGYVNALASEDYSISTVKKGYNLLTSFIRFAFGEGLAIRPAYLNVKLPRPENIAHQTRTVAAYTPEEQQSLRNEIEKSSTLGAKAALLLLETGLRVGELLALRWSDVQWQRRAVRIHATLVNPQSRKRCYVQNSSKSKSSTRTIPLSTRAMSVLMSLPKTNPDALIFTSDDGTTSVAYNSLRNQIRTLCNAAGVEYRGLHAFRHTFATNCYYKGCEIKILSKLLGHSSVTITYNTYINLYGDALEEMRSIVD